MVFGYTEEEILRAAVESQCNITDGVAAYNYTTGKLHSCAYTTGETEHPDNHLIEIYRLRNGEDGELDCHCWENGDCPFWIDDDNYLIGGHFNEDMLDEYGNYRIDCCINGVADELDLETDDLENLVHHILQNHLGKTLEKLSDIRLAVLDIVKPNRYVENRMEDWYESTLDVYTDLALDDGFSINNDPLDYLESEVIQIENYCLYGMDYGSIPGGEEIVKLMRSGDLDGALKLLQ